MNDIAAQMRDDWNRRAREDANYYVAFGRHEQSEADFAATAADVLRSFDKELARGLPGENPRARRALEIGCGPGRLLKPLAARFGEIHGVDVSDEMIALARQRLAGLPHAHAHIGSGADLAQFADESFDFIYSYAVFQHIPELAVVQSYLEDAARVLKPGGLLRFQANNLSAVRTSEATWHGCSLEPAEIRAYALRHALQLLALEGAATQYMWVTIRKPLPVAPLPAGPAIIRRITNSESSEPVAPARGRYAAISVWIENAPADADLLTLELRVRGLPSRLTYLGKPEADGIRQLNAVLPAGLATGIAPVELLYRGASLASSAFRIIPASPAVPRLVEAVDGHNISLGTRIVSRTVKLFLEELDAPEHLHASVAGQPCEDYSILCTDPMGPRHEVNFRLPDGLHGPQTLRVELGRRLLGAIPIEIQG